MFRRNLIQVWIGIISLCAMFLLGQDGDWDGHPTIEGLWREFRQDNLNGNPPETWTWPWTCNIDLDQDGVLETVTHDVYWEYAQGHYRHFLVYLNIVDPGGSVNIGGTTPVYYCSTVDGTYTQEGDIVTDGHGDQATVTFSGNTMILTGEEMIPYFEPGDPSVIATAVDVPDHGDPRVNGCY